MEWLDSPSDVTAPCQKRRFSEDIDDRENTMGVSRKRGRVSTCIAPKTRTDLFQVYDGDSDMYNEADGANGNASVRRGDNDKDCVERDDKDGEEVEGEEDDSVEDDGSEELGESEDADVDPVELKRWYEIKRKEAEREGKPVTGCCAPIDSQADINHAAYSMR